MTPGGIDAAPRPAVTWLDHFRDARNRWLTSERFQRWAARSKFARPVARRRARALFDLCAGFVYSQVLYACVNLRVFEQLASGPLPLEELARRTALEQAAAARLLDAAVSLDLLERRSASRYALGELGAALLGNPGVAAMVAHHAMLYEDLADPVALLREPGRPTRLSDYWAYASRSEGALGAADVEAYTSLMAASQSFVADDVLDAWPLTRYRCLLDVGGGDGTFVLKAASRAPGLRLQLFDLPPVAERARRRLAQAGLADRAEAVGGSFFDGALPVGADVATLLRVIHDHDDAGALQILRAVAKALPADGTLLLAEPMANAPGVPSVGDAYFGFYFLAMGQGRVRSPERLCELLRDAGFRTARRVPTARPLLVQLIVAQQPRSSASVNKT
jgi:demethylspheroidene O-methyltransferase